MDLAPLQLKRNEHRRLQAGHLWIYSNEVDTKTTPLKNFEPGQQVLVKGADNKLLGVAYVNPQSLICGRLISHTKEILDENLLLRRIKNALTLRQAIFDAPYYRLVYGESDLLPGLVVDRFGDHLAVQINSAGMDNVTDEIVETLQKVIEPQSIILRNDSSVRALEGLPLNTVEVFGNCPKEVELVENGAKMMAPLQAGQKTGWFYDQRLNRLALKDYVNDKRVLDVFSYVGSFAIQAATFGASQAWSVDSSRFALEMAEKNSVLNGVENKFTAAQGDAFDVLRALKEEKEYFDIIVVDPPAFIKRKKDHKAGLQAYYRINDLAIKLLKPQGFLLSASCSMHLQQKELLDVVRRGARKNKRHAQIVFEGSQGPDHPVHPAIPETRYLKAILTRMI